MGLFDKFKRGLTKTVKILNTDVRDLFKSEGRLIDDEFLDEMRAILFKTDMGFVSAEEAANVYGIVAVDGAIDVAATSARRASLSNERSTEEFVFGPERAAYEARLPSSVQDLVAELLVVYPAATRQFLRDRLYARIESDAGLRGSSATRRALQAVLEETMARWLPNRDAVHRRQREAAR